MSRFTLYLCLLVGLIAVVTAASLKFNDGAGHGIQPTKECLGKCESLCHSVADLPSKRKCIDSWVQKICHH